MRGEDTGKHRIRPKLLQLRIGVNLGEVIVGADGDLFGDGINIAVRLEGIADPGGILISDKVYSEVEGKLDVGFEDRGEQQLKNISKPVRAYAVRAGAHQGESPEDKCAKSWKSAKTRRGIASFVTRHQTSCLRLCSNPLHCAVPRPGLEFEEPLGVQVRHLRFVIRADRQIFEEALAGSVVAIRVVDGE